MHLCPLQFKIIYRAWKKHLSWPKSFQKPQTSIKRAVGEGVGGVEGKDNRKEVPMAAFPQTLIHWKANLLFLFKWKVCHEGNRQRNRNKIHKDMHHKTHLIQSTDATQKSISAVVLGAESFLWLTTTSLQLQAPNFLNYFLLNCMQCKTGQLQDHLGCRYPFWNLPSTPTALKYVSLFC